MVTRSKTPDVDQKKPPAETSAQNPLFARWTGPFGGAATLAILGVTACGLGQSRWRATPEQMAPLPVLTTKVSSSIGPLAIEPGAGKTPWPDVMAARTITEDHYLDRQRIHDETTTFLELVDTFYLPLTSETKIGFDQAHRDLSRLEDLAPYSIWNVTLAFQQSTQRLNLCILNAGVMAPCYRDLKPRPKAASAFEIGEAAPGIGLLAVHDLRDAGDPAWRGFAGAAQSLAGQRGLVIDLRDAVGADPRGLLPWVATLTGRTEIKPLRAIERPPSADTYVDAYRARFTDRGRDPEIWRALLASDDAPRAAGAPVRPIAIVVGPQCESACELIARVLETYAGAVVIGGVASAGRLARDEPAMLVLPHSQTSVYFHATRYLLAREIEAATGPTEEWTALGGDGPDPAKTDDKDARSPYPVTDHMTFAKREVAQRIASPAGWPRCDSFPVVMPVTDTAKLRGVFYLSSPRSCGAGYQITIQTQVPASALRRFLSTCSTQPQISSYTPGLYGMSMPAKPAPELLSQIAASELIDMVNIECQPQYHIN